MVEPQETLRLRRVFVCINSKPFHKERLNLVQAGNVHEGISGMNETVNLKFLSFTLNRICLPASF